MKRYIAVVCLLVVLSGMLSGCRFWEGEYVSIEPYQQQNHGSEKTFIEVANYQQMCDAVVDLIESGAKSGILRAPSYSSGTVHFYMDSAIRQATESTAMGAYAVDNISYEIGIRSGVEAIALNITYRRELSQILRMNTAEDMDAALEMLLSSLEDHQSAASVRVFAYEEQDISGYVLNHILRRQDLFMEVPAIQTNVYPDSGDERIVEVELTYEHSREQLRKMQEKVVPVFTAAELYARGATQVREKYAQLYAFLMERTSYAYETSSTPSYSLLIEGKGDCVAFATVYAQMCEKAGLDCYVVNGTRDGQPWTWNVIDFRGSLYHLDLLLCNETDGFAPKMRSAMDGYQWDESQLKK